MGRCESYGTCSFFQNEMGAMPSMIRRLATLYCNNDKERCARYMIKKKAMQGYTLPEGRRGEELEKILDGLYPNDLARAKEVISQMVI